MKLFLDVGAHVGETLKPALDPRYGFDKVVCFEPVESCWAILEEFTDTRIDICKFGLWNETERRPIYSPGNIGASLFSSVEDGGELVELRKASDWFEQNISTADEIYLKLNCEGSECDILDDLLDSGEMSKVTSILVDFDVRKIPSMEHRERQVRDRMLAAGYSSVLCLKELYKGPTHTATVENWLRFAGGRPLPPSGLWRWRYEWFPAAVRKAIPAGRRLAKWLPRSSYERLRRLLQDVIYAYPSDAGKRQRREKGSTR